MIKFIFFDVGGVVIHDFSANNGWLKLLKNIGISRLQEKSFNLFWSKHARNVCTTLDVDELIPLLKHEFDLQFQEDFSLLSEFVDGFSENEDIWPIIHEVKKVFQVGLLTNMYPRMLNAIQKKGILPEVKWDVVIDSSLVGFEKPDKEIYELAQKHAKCEPQEILFIDNSENHLQKASEIGWQTFHYNPQNITNSNQGLLKKINAASG